MDKAIGIFMEKSHYYYSAIKNMLFVHNVFFDKPKDYEEFMRNLAKLFDI